MSQLQDSGFLEDLFDVCPETWVALDTANLVTLICFQKYGKDALSRSKVAFPGVMITLMMRTCDI